MKERKIFYVGKNANNFCRYSAVMEVKHNSQFLRYELYIMTSLSRVLHGNGDKKEIFNRKALPQPSEHS